MIGGVAGGVAEYFDVDPTIIRILFVVGLFMGAGILAYIVLWIVVPEEPLVVAASDDTVNTVSAESSTGTENQEAQGDKKASRKNKTGYFGAILIVLGVLLLIDNFVRFDAFWPLLLILGGIGILLKARND